MKESLPPRDAASAGSLKSLSLILLIASACLAISLCLSLYLLDLSRKNSQLEQAMAQMRFAQQKSDTVFQVAQAMVNDLKMLSATDRNAAGMLQKFGAPIAELHLDVQDRGLQ